MPEHDPFDDRSRTLFRYARRLEPEPPPFERLWQQAVRQRDVRQRAPRVGRRPSLRRALIPTLAAVLLLTVASAWLGKVRASRQAAEVHALLASVRAATATPLDFLLETPGSELLRQTPRFGETVPSIDLSLDPLLEN